MIIINVNEEMHVHGYYERENRIDGCHLEQSWTKNVDHYLVKNPGHISVSILIYTTFQFTHKVN